ncbi:hypothetical protein JCM10908_001116 [Rhodotorula pacifica]|uniref:uncharacterized protein n=1 Tax=Rhodotorula pacifica TaxID=1495444 RepID=UPI003179FF6E
MASSSRQQQVHALHLQELQDAEEDVDRLENRPRFRSSKKQEELDKWAAELDQAQLDRATLEATVMWADLCRHYRYNWTEIEVAAGAHSRHAAAEADRNYQLSQRLGDDAIIRKRAHARYLYADRVSQLLLLHVKTLYDEHEFDHGHSTELPLYSHDMERRGRHDTQGPGRSAIPLVGRQLSNRRASGYDMWAGMAANPTPLGGYASLDEHEPETHFERDRHHSEHLPHEHAHSSASAHAELDGAGAHHHAPLRVQTQPRRLASTGTVYYQRQDSQ